MKCAIYILLLLTAVPEVSALGNSGPDTSAAIDYPLNVGNMYVYDQISLWFNCNPFTLTRKIRVSITDYVAKPNGKSYYKFSGWWPVGGNARLWIYQRVDTASKNVYLYDSTSNSELLLDSLLIRQGDTFRCARFNNQSPYALCNSVEPQQIFGQTRLMKFLAANTHVAITAYYSLADGIGFTGYSQCEVGTGTNYSLAGCRVGGIVYGDTTLTGITQISAVAPDNFSLIRSYPNPFNPSTIIEYSVPAQSRSGLAHVSLIVYSSEGREVAMLADKDHTAGKYAAYFDATSLPAGVYFCRMTASESGRVVFINSLKLLLVK